LWVGSGFGVLVRCCAGFVAVEVLVAVDTAVRVAGTAVIVRAGV